MKITVELDSEKDSRQQVRCISEALDLALCVHDIQEYLRQLDKYGESQTVNIVDIRDHINEMINDRIGSINRLLE